MPETPNDTDQEKGDEVLRRLLKTPPDPKGKPRASDSDQKKGWPPGKAGRPG